MTRRSLHLLAVLVCICGLAAGADAAQASTAGERFLQAISSGSPFIPGDCGVPGQLTPNSTGEPSDAVNPRDPNNVVAVWQQDRFTIDGGALSNLVSVSKDGGRSWRQVEVPGLSRCTGGSDERTSDPWVSIGPDGTVYLATLTFTEHPELAGLAGPTAMRLSRSHDGGLTWTQPTTIVNDNVYDDRESVTADPKRPGTAYYVWVRRLGVLGEQGIEYFSRTTDGGATWSTPRPITVLQPGTLPDPSIVRVLPDGTLVDFYLLANATPFLPPSVPRIPWQVTEQRSTDGGATWSAPVKIADIDPPSAPADPTSGAVIRAYNEISPEIAPDGTAYVAWNVIHSQSSSQILVAKSTDGARSWGAPAAAANVASQAFLPSLSVTGDGTVGVTWDDLRNDTPGSSQLTTDVWFAHSHDRGGTWQQSHVAGSFDTLTAAPTDSTSVAGRFLGDFQGLAAFPAGFAAVFVQGRPQATHGGTDTFFARLDLGSAPAASPRAMRLTITPLRVPALRSELFTATVRSGGKPLAGVKVRLAGASGTTGANGRVRLNLTLRPGAYVATATKRGYRRATARVAAIGAAPAPRFTG